MQRKKKHFVRAERERFRLQLMKGLVSLRRLRGASKKEGKEASIRGSGQGDANRKMGKKGGVFSCRERRKSITQPLGEEKKGDCDRPKKREQISTENKRFCTPKEEKYPAGEGKR